MNIIDFFKTTFSGPAPEVPAEPVLTVTFYLRGGQTVVVYGVKELKATKNMDGRYSGYTITWHEGRSLPLVSFALEDISAIVAR